MCKEEQVHRGPNDLEDMNMLRYKWLTGNGVARETMAKACSDVDNYLSQSFTAFILKAPEQKKITEKLLQVVLSQKSQNCSIT